jgi:hypothetical protein
LGAIAFVYFQKLISSWKEWQGTVFGLERESAQRRFSTSLTILLLLVLFVVVEFVIVSFVTPNYPQVSSLPTATLDVLATPTVTLPALVQAVQAEITEEVTATPNMQTFQEGCIAGQIEWIYPLPGDTVSATIELRGTVNIPNLGYYKYEYSQPGEEIWFPIAAGNQAKVDGQIGFWDTKQRDSGDYLLRLVVMDNEENAFPACIVPVRVVNTP